MQSGNLEQNLVNASSKKIKRKIMHIGNKNNHFHNTIDNQEDNKTFLIEITQVEKDLGIVMSKYLKFSAQSKKAAYTANKSLGILKCPFKFIGVNIWKKNFTSHTYGRI